MSTLRRALPWILLVPGALLAVGLAGLLVAWPSLLTGGACEVTIESIDVDVEGGIRIRYHAWLAYRTNVASVAPVPPGTNTCVGDTHSWSECPPRFARRARLAKDGHIGAYARLKRLEKGPQGPDLAAIRAGLTVGPGTYRVRPGNPLVYWRGTDTDGTLYEGVLLARPEP
jgi:hypothetical protein